MHHYNSVLLLQITICNDTDGDHNNGATIQQYLVDCDLAVADVLSMFGRFVMYTVEKHESGAVYDSSPQVWHV